jgi:hypothetical protein
MRKKKRGVQKRIIVIDLCDNNGAVPRLVARGKMDETNNQQT